MNMHVYQARHYPFAARVDLLELRELFRAKFDFRAHFGYDSVLNENVNYSVQSPRRIDNPAIAQDKIN